MELSGAGAASPLTAYRDSPDEPRGTPVHEASQPVRDLNDVSGDPDSKRDFLIFLANAITSVVGFVAFAKLIGLCPSSDTTPKMRSFCQYAPANMVANALCVAASFKEIANINCRSLPLCRLRFCQLPLPEKGSHCPQFKLDSFNLVRYAAGSLACALPLIRWQFDDDQVLPSVLSIINGTAQILLEATNSTARPPPTVPTIN